LSGRQVCLDIQVHDIYGGGRIGGRFIAFEMSSHSQCGSFLEVWPSFVSNCSWELAIYIVVPQERLLPKIVEQLPALVLPILITTFRKV
jgi:hypothetical protein